MLLPAVLVLLSLGLSDECKKGGRRGSDYGYHSRGGQRGGNNGSYSHNYSGLGQNVGDGGGIKSYYWKDYTGQLPPDAFVAGESADGSRVYIGQAFRANKGILPVQINPGHKEVYSFTDGRAERTERGIRILCGEAYIFEWLSTDTEKFSADVVGKPLVIGGFQCADPYPERNLFIGRNGSIIGKIDPFFRKLYYHYNGMELELTNYQILTAKNYEDSKFI